MRRALLGLASIAVVACRDPAPDGRAQPHVPVSTAAAPTPIRYVIGGDSRQDAAHVVPWAFQEAKARGVAAFVFLGDMEIKPSLDEHFRGGLAQLAPVPFFPVLGNHETVHRALGADVPREDRVRALSAYRALFLGTAGTPVESVFDDKLVYAVDLAGGVHFIALDNVTQPGFGKDQLAWLAGDLDRAGAPGGKARHVVVGMHKALVGSGITTHAMDEDGPAALADSAAALALFERAHVELIVASHFHAFAEYAQHGIRSFITGGMGAPLDASPSSHDGAPPQTPAHDGAPPQTPAHDGAPPQTPAHDGAPPQTPARASAFHHVLLVAVPEGAPLTIEVLRFPGPPSVGVEDER